MLIKIATTSDIPIYKQLRDQIIIGIAKGELQADEQLPSVRQLAEEIGVNSMTISKAYNLLKDEGYLITDRRLGTKVAHVEKISEKISEDLFMQLMLILAEISIRTPENFDVIASVEDILKDFRRSE